MATYKCPDVLWFYGSMDRGGLCCWIVVGDGWLIDCCDAQNHNLKSMLYVPMV